MSPKLAPPDPKDGKEKPSRNHPERTATLVQDNSEELRRPKPKEAAHKKVLTNTQPKRRQDKTET